LTSEDIDQIKEESKTWLNDEPEDKTAPGEPKPSTSGAAASGGAGASSESEGAVGGAVGGSK